PIMTTYAAVINKVLNHHAHLLSNIGTDDALPGGPKFGWRKYCKLFSDGIILWALYNKAGDVEDQRKAIVATIVEAMDDLDVNRSNVKVLTMGDALEGGFFSLDLVDEHQDSFDGAYIPGYICIKVTLHHHSLVLLIPSLKPILCKLKEEFILLHDIDITTDCQYVTTRKILQEYLEQTLEDQVEIIHDRNKVGNHCLSWYMTTHKDQRVRCKMYNKLVQMLESAEVRTSIGSRMESIVMPVDAKFHKRLYKAKKKGLSRLEVTFYGPKLHKYSYYEHILETVKEHLEECPTFCVPHKAYWRQFAGNISSMVGVHVTKGNETAFAYCHWWNAITTKKYGSCRLKVQKDEAMKLLANYSFNKRPIYFLEVTMDGNTIVETKVAKYMRPEGCTAITLVAGQQKSLYPYLYHDDVKCFKDMGIVKVDNIKIQWPKRRLRKSSPPIVDIHLVPMDDEGMFIQVHGSATHKSTFEPGYQVLQKDTLYLVASMAKDTFRGKEYIFATLSSGIRVRCGKLLEQMLLSWLDDYPKAEAPWMPFTAGEKRKTGGQWDIQVE
ncbi:hypothetical protein BGZ52_005334, partial [Haplosporangium bisporale]